MEGEGDLCYFLMEDCIALWWDMMFLSSLNDLVLCFRFDNNYKFVVYL